MYAMMLRYIYHHVIKIETYWNVNVITIISDIDDPN